MTVDFHKNYRKLSRNFKSQVELANRTSIEILEKMLVELHDFYVQNYIKTENEKYPEKSRKEIIIEMYQLREKLKGRKKK